MGGPATTVLWFRRDLRLADHPALTAAVARGRVLPLFVHDPRLRGPAGTNRLAYLHATLDALAADVATLGGRLVERSGDPVAAVPAVAREVGAASVAVTADHGPYGRRRDEAVAAALAADGRRLEPIGTPYAVAPGTLRTTTGSPYRVFTPFARAWRAHGRPDPLPVPPLGPASWAAGVASDRRPPTPTAEATAGLPAAGEAAAHAIADRFLARGVHDYDRARDRPDLDATSRLSPHLRWGTIHPRQLLDRSGDGAGPERFATELAWREFHADVLHHRPETAREPVVSTLDHLTWDHGPLAEERFAAWCAGRTGYPVVDAGMRQLLGEGWMHNRVRMVTASFLVKDLHLDWRRGARWFMRHLVDGDLASNQHGWQWVAGTGTDAAPFFRVFNPTTQAKRVDPDGDYVRRWVPELRGVPGAAVHEPHAGGGGLFAAAGPDGYPAPIVDHAEERAEALARYHRR